MNKKLPAWLVLTLIALVAALALGATYNGTKDTIAKQEAEKAVAVRQELLPAATDFALCETEEGAAEVWRGLNADGSAAGYVSTGTVTGFGGPVEVTVGTDAEGIITGVRVGGANFQETAGLGAKSKEPAFYEQFTGKAYPVDLTKNGGEIDAITAATITSSAVVRGVYEDFPDNCIAENCIYRNMGKENEGNFQNYNYICYLRMKEQMDTEKVKQQILDPLLEQMHQIYIEHGMEDHWDEADKRESLNLRLLPITETWFSGIDPEHDRGNKTVDWILRLSCLLVLIIAAINFLNFTLAESPMRIKSINTRRVLGSSVSSLRLSIIGEAVCTSLLAFLLAVVVCYLLSQWPFISELTVGSITLSNHLWLIIGIGMAAVLVGVVAGVYPAFYATSFQPALVLKGSFGLTPKGRQLRTSLLCLQFLITSIMVIYIGILYLQSHYIFNSDYGYNKDEILYVDTRELLDKHDALRSELMQQTGIVDVAYSQFSLGTGDRYMGWGRGDKNHQVQFTALPVDWHYLRTMGIEVIEGRDFNEHDGDVYIINECARKKWDWVKMDQKLLDEETEMTVVGVCRNVRFASTRIDNNDSPMAFLIFGEKYLKEGWTNNLDVMNVRVAAGVDKVAMRQKIKDICMKLGAQHEPEVKFLDQQLEHLYQEEFRFIRQVLVFSVICLIITLIGVFCMTMFETEYRRKEIGIRKVMGSSTREILQLFCKKYILLLLISFIIAAPIAYFIGSQWLQNFSERTPIYWWLFPLTFLAICLITMITVIIQSWRTANANPVESIKTE